MCDKTVYKRMEVRDLRFNPFNVLKENLQFSYKKRKKKIDLHLNFLFDHS